MASFPKEHNSLYFDALIRTQKKESVLAFIMATYYAKKNNTDDNVRKDIYKRLEYAYGLFRDNVRGYDNGVGSYGGTDSQFSSQYTLGLEMGIWKNSRLDLNDLALKVAKNEITITEYFDIVLLNYIQPVSGKIIHPLYKILCYIKKTNGESINKFDFFTALELPVASNFEAINALYNILIGTSYFEDSNNILVLSKKYNIDELLVKCNKKYLGEDGYVKAKQELENNDDNYINYLISISDTDDEICEYNRERFRLWLENSGKYTETTIKNYVYYVNYIRKNGYTEYDLYKINDLKIIDDLLIKFKNDEKYIEFNKINHGSPSSSLDAYKLFLLSDNHIDKSKEYSYDQRITGAYNMIYYGTPGCGKSFKVNKDFNQNDYLVYRTTFHPEYSNSDFVGQIIPKTENNEIKYEFQEGPFTLALCEAIKKPLKKVCLIIEEINRGNASAIFGDIFQLLDRENDGSSVYSINNEAVKNYLNKNGVNIEKITIPSNMWIIATMNTSDQNVFTLDTAFKRRWRMHRIINKFDKNELYDNKLASMYIPGSSYTWEQFITTINKEIMRKNPTGLNSEDKQLGVYFVTENELSIIPVNNDKDSMDKFIEKVLLYIWDDVAKLDPTLWFDENINSFDELIKSYYDNKLHIFKDIFKDQNNELQIRDINEEN